MSRSNFWALVALPIVCGAVAAATTRLLESTPGCVVQPQEMRFGTVTEFPASEHNNDEFYVVQSDIGPDLICDSIRMSDTQWSRLVPDARYAVRCILRDSQFGDDFASICYLSDPSIKWRSLPDTAEKR